MGKEAWSNLLGLEGQPSEMPMKTSHYKKKENNQSIPCGGNFSMSIKILFVT